MKKIISYSLWGNKKKYTIGAIKNAQNNLLIYPEFISRFYVDLTVPKDVLYSLEDLPNTEVILRSTIGDWKFSLQRFLPFSEKDVQCFLSRDCDSRCSLREKNAVDVWLKSDKNFHIMRDHPYHGGFPILAGMFASKGGIIEEIEELIQKENLLDTYHSDQIFLQKYVYPKIKNDCIIHDEFFEKNSFPTKRINKEYVGAPLDENDNLCFPEYSELL